MCEGRSYRGTTFIMCQKYHSSSDRHFFQNQVKTTLSLLRTYLFPVTQELRENLLQRMSSIAAATTMHMLQIHIQISHTCLSAHSVSRLQSYLQRMCFSKCLPPQDQYLILNISLWEDIRLLLFFITFSYGFWP